MIPEKCRQPSLLLALLLAAAPCSQAANVEVPSLELFTRGSLSGGAVDLQTEGEMDLSVQGGVKFGGNVTLGFSSSSLEQDFASKLYAGSAGGTTLTFASASVVIREIFSLPLDVTYFIGERDEFVSGEAFTEVLGTAPIATQYCGFLYFPDSVRYEGIHTAAGTGLKLSSAGIAENLYTAAYFYQDGYFYETVDDEIRFVPGHYSAEVHSLLDLHRIKLEALLGATFPVSAWGYYRWGFLFYAADAGGEFLAQIGMPRWDPVNDTVDLDLFFLLFEARLHLGTVTLIQTVFLHPGYYRQYETAEEGLLDFNLNLRVGKFEQSLMAGGLEANAAFMETNLQGLRILLAPYLTFATSGVLWQLKINTKVFPSLDFEGYVGIKAEF